MQNRVQLLFRLMVWIAGCGVGFVAVQSEAADLPLAPTEKADQVIVLKAERKLLLMRNNQVLRTYRVSLGGDPVGPKRRRGDSKTPEGEYVLDRRNPKSQFYRSIHISYPNADDVSRARKLGFSPGGDLFIHGLPGWLKPNSKHRLPLDWTDGCIAVTTNHEMDEIWVAVADGTPIVIKP